MRVAVQEGALRDLDLRPTRANESQARHVRPIVPQSLPRLQTAGDCDLPPEIDPKQDPKIHAAPISGGQVKRATLSRREKIKRLTLERRKEENLHNAA